MLSFISLPLQEAQGDTVNLCKWVLEEVLKPPTYQDLTTCINCSKHWYYCAFGNPGCAIPEVCKTMPDCTITERVLVAAEQLVNEWVWKCNEVDPKEEFYRWLRQQIPSLDQLVLPGAFEAARVDIEAMKLAATPIPDRVKSQIKGLIQPFVASGTSKISTQEINAGRLISTGHSNASLYLRGGFDGITLYDLIILRSPNIYDVLMNNAHNYSTETILANQAPQDYVSALKILVHELVHVRQYSLLGYNAFLTNYLIETISRGYGNDSFEQEANAFRDKVFAQIKVPPLKPTPVQPVPPAQPPPGKPTPAEPPAQPPPAHPVPGKPTPAVSEDCVPFNPNTTTVSNIQGRWKIVDGSHWLFDFGSNKAEADRSLQIIKHYGMNQSCFVGRPQPSFIYMLVSGHAPTGSLAGEDCISFNPATANVGQIQGDWKIVDGSKWMLSFGSKEAEARQALAIIKQHSFNQVCYVGRPNPSFQYLKGAVAATPVRPPPAQPVPPAQRPPGKPLPGKPTPGTCTYLFSQTGGYYGPGSYTPAGGPGGVSVTAPGDCPWTSASNVDWITITSGSSGSGNGTVNYSVSLNDTSSARSGTLTIAGQTVTVTQTAGGKPPKRK